MIETGLRVGEVVQLDRSSVELGNGQDSGGSGTNSGAGKMQNGTSTAGRRLSFTALTADWDTAHFAGHDPKTSHPAGAGADWRHKADRLALSAPRAGNHAHAARCRPQDRPGAPTTCQ
jgi:hypothetical protein